MSEAIEAMGKALPEFTISWHADVDEVLNLYWSPVAEAEGMTLPELFAESTLNGETADGVELEITEEQMREGIIEQGVWGFIDESNHITAWAAPETPIATLLHFLGHEIGHAVEDVVHEDEGIKEELRADQYGMVAAKAYELSLTRPV